MKKLVLSIAFIFIVTSTMFAISAGYSVHVKLEGSATAPSIWAWSGAANYSNGTIIGNAWPGSTVPGTAGANGYFTFTFPDGVVAATAFVIFNNGAVTGSIKTIDLPAIERPFLTSQQIIKPLLLVFQRQFLQLSLLKVLLL